MDFSKKNFNKLFYITIISLTFSSCAFAQDADDGTYQNADNMSSSLSSIRHGFFGSIGLGVGFAIDDLKGKGDYDNSDPGHNMLPGIGKHTLDHKLKPEHATVIPNLTLGYEWDSFGVDIQANQYSFKYKGTKSMEHFNALMPIKFTKFYGSVYSTNFLLQGYYKYNTQSKFSFYAGGGLGIEFNHLILMEKMARKTYDENIINRSFNKDGKSHTMIASIDLGSQYNVNKHLSLLLKGSAIMPLEKDKYKYAYKLLTNYSMTYTFPAIGITSLEIKYYT